MSREIDDVFDKIRGFKETIQDVLTKGLIDKDNFHKIISSLNLQEKEITKTLSNLYN
jgi:hypothetical protein